MQSSNLREHGIVTTGEVLRNPVVARLYEDAVKYDGGILASTGALVAMSGAKTGRSPKDKHIVEHPESAKDIWWDEVNHPQTEAEFQAHRRLAVEYLASRPRLYVIDGFAGWAPRYRQKIRIICARPYHALFMHNMLMRPAPGNLASFDRPDYVIFNAGECPASDGRDPKRSTTSVDVNFESQEMVILGTEYAGEMKKGVFTIMNYLMPKRGVLSMHCSANEGVDSDVSLFFGLSGTGKTTLSADGHRRLIGDDEHCWSDEGVFNIEGGCYAKCVGLTAEKEPQIYQAIRVGSVLENTTYDKQTREVDFESTAITENTRACYPIEYIPHAKIPCTGGHPRNVILLTCDAFGVLPPVAKLTPPQLMYHFVSGYSAKVAGTEMGVTEPQATFSACFGAAFLVWHPTVYAEMLAEKMNTHQASAWLINTGWSGGKHGVGSRIKLAHTRAIIDAIHSGELDRVPTRKEPLFGLHIPEHCPRVPDEILFPEATWRDKAAYRQTAQTLAGLFAKNFAKYESSASDATRAAGPRVSQKTTAK